MLKFIVMALGLSFFTGCDPGYFDHEEEIPTPIYNKKVQSKGIIVSHNTLDGDFISVTSANHRRYAQKQNYHYWFRNGCIAGKDVFKDPHGNGKVRQLGLYWQKIQAVADALELKTKDGNARRYEWVMWVDADAVFTNMSIRIEDIFAQYPDKDFLIASDKWHGTHDSVNSGVFIVKNTEFSRKMWKRVVALYDCYKNKRTPEQQAIQDVIFAYVDIENGRVTEPSLRSYDERDLLPQTVIVSPQRLLNAFYTSAFHAPEDARWHKGDFIAHLAGSKRMARLRKLKVENTHL